MTPNVPREKPYQVHTMKVLRVYVLSSSMANEHGFCKHCGADFDGGDIIEEFVRQDNTLEEATKIATECYGYGPGHTKWGRQIGIYNIYLDRTVDTQCPDCKGMQSCTKESS